MARFIKNDGGRAAAGYKGETGDCVTRAIAIASGRPYQEVYDALAARAKTAGRGSPRNGVARAIYAKYLQSLGATWTATVGIGTGCKIHVRADQLPSGRLVLRLSKHLAAYVDGAVHDTHDPRRFGERCVYGYWTIPEAR